MTDAAPAEACHVCRRPVHGAFLCEPCLGELEAALGDVDTLASALEVAYLRQQRFSVTAVKPPSPDAEAESVVPFNDKASRLRRELSRELLRWVLHVHDAHGVSWVPIPASSRSTSKAMSSRLLWALPYFRAHPAGVEAHQTFTGLQTRILRCVDRPPDLVYLGVCSMPVADGQECPEDLYAEWGKDYATCARCKTNHRVEDRRAVLINAVKDQLATAADISRGLSGLDMKCTADRIRQWKRRGRIAERGPNHNGDPMYRVGDVIDLLLESQHKKGKRK